MWFETGSKTHERLTGPAICNPKSKIKEKARTGEKAQGKEEDSDAPEKKSSKVKRSEQELQDMEGACRHQSLGLKLTDIPCHR